MKRLCPSASLRQRTAFEIVSMYTSSDLPSLEEEAMPSTSGCCPSSFGASTALRWKDRSANGGEITCAAVSAALSMRLLMVDGSLSVTIFTRSMSSEYSAMTVATPIEASMNITVGQPVGWLVRAATPDAAYCCRLLSR